MRDKSQLVLPIETEILIEKNDSVYQLHEICKELDYTKLYETYVRSWRKVDPSTLFEIMVFSYMKGIYSGRQIEEACKNDIRFMWLLDGEPAPSHATISRFQEERLSEVIEELFYQLIEVLFELGEVKFENIFVDGTKIEANANKYTFVWKKAVEKILEKLEIKIEKKKKELAVTYGLNPEEKAINCYETLLSRAQLIGLVFVNGRGKHKTQLQRDVEELGRYLEKKEENLAKLGKMKGRNSYSKTDIDATFMRMKEDYMKNGQLKPGYNIQIGVESEYIVGLGSFPNPTDVQTLIPFMERIYKNTKRRFGRVIADAGYESIENYLYLKEYGQKCFIKPQNYENSKKRSYRSNKYIAENLPYDKEKDLYFCPRGDEMVFNRKSSKETANGYKINHLYYKNESCSGCEHYGKCHHSVNEFRTVRVTEGFRDFREEAFKNITDDLGVLLRKNRSIQVEGAFGVLKQDKGFRRFLTRGKKNIETQFFILAFAFNIQKLYYRKKSGRFGIDLFTSNVS